MTAASRYARIQGSFWRHERTAPLSLAAAGLHARAMSYCADQMTDGVVLRHILGALCGGAIDDAVVGELVASGVWKECKGAYSLRDWSQHNITRAGWEKQKAETKARIAAHRAKRSREEVQPSYDPGTPVQPPPSAPGTSSSLDEGRRTKDEDLSFGESSPAPVVRGTNYSDGLSLKEFIRQGAVKAYESLTKVAPKQTRDPLWVGWHELEGWVLDKARLTKRDEREVARHLFQCFMRSKRARGQGYPIAFLRENGDEYWRDELPAEVA